VGDGERIPLCQPDSGKSCGACCGIYNYADSSQRALTVRLRRRTERFRASVRGEADLAAFSSWVHRVEDPARRFEVNHCCEFAGFLDGALRRVGCLLHPAQNDGVDLREASFYGRELCAGHRCPSDHFLTPAEKRMVIYLLEDWYLYGLCLTDIDLVKHYFRLLADRLGECPDPERFRHESVRAVARDFFHFKIRWPYRSPETNRFGRFYFDGTQHLIRPIDYEGIGCERSPLDGVFLSLASRFRNEGELRRAEERIGAVVDRCVAAYSAL